MSKSNLTLTVRSPKIIRFLTRIIILLILFSLIGSYFRFIMEHEHVYGFVPKFDLDRENNIPTYFSSFILLVSASLIAIIAVYEKRKKEAFSTHWYILSIIFLYLSVDESASLHELVNPVRDILDLSGIFYSAWVIVGIVFVFFFTVFYLKFFLNLPPTVRHQFLIAGLVYVCGALGVELVGGYYKDAYGVNHLTYSMITTIEESFEMIGILLFIKALLKYIDEKISNLVFTFG